MMELYTLEQIPFYDSHNQCYRQIITINQMPSGPLKDRVRRINMPLLSPFQYPSPQCCTPSNCVLALYDEQGQLLCANQIPLLMQYLMQNGYEIDYQLSELMEKPHIRSTNPLICYIKYQKN